MPTPVVEWWDMPLCQAEVKNGKRQVKLVDGKPQLHLAAVTHFVHHPVPIKGKSSEAVKALDPASMLTPQERKKLRKRRKEERAQKIRDQIRMGLMKPPPPKVKFSTLMRMMADDQIANPSAVEQKVKEETEQRRKQHEARNAAAKTDEATVKERKKNKWKGGTIESGQVVDPDNKEVAMTQVMLVQFRDVNNQQHFKVKMNAIQFELTGVLILCPGIANLLLVEGGKRAMTKYKKLLTRRIKWDGGDAEEKGDSDDDMEDKDDNDKDEKKGSACTIMWEGTQKARVFPEFKVHQIKTEAEARQVLAARSCEHYWTMVERFRDSATDL